MSEPIAYLRDLDGTSSLHVCAAGDPGAIPVYHADEIERLRAAIKPLIMLLEGAPRTHIYEMEVISEAREALSVNDTEATTETK